MSVCARWRWGGRGRGLGCARSCFPSGLPDCFCDLREAFFVVVVVVVVARAWLAVVFKVEKSV